MRFDIAMLCAFAATTQLATATPGVQWNGKGAEAGYKFGAVACAVGTLVCNSQGYTVGAYTLGTGAFCCSTAGAAVTASQSEGWKRAWLAAANKLGDGARLVKGGYSKVGKLAATCSSKVCKMVRKEPGLPRRSLDRPRRNRGPRRSADRSEKRGISRRSIDEHERKRIPRSSIGGSKKARTA